MLCRRLALALLALAACCSAAEVGAAPASPPGNASNATSNVTCVDTTPHCAFLVRELEGCAPAEAAVRASLHAQCAATCRAEAKPRTCPPLRPAETAAVAAAAEADRKWVAAHAAAYDHYLDGAPETLAQPAPKETYPPPSPPPPAGAQPLPAAPPATTADPPPASAPNTTAAAADAAADFASLLLAPPTGSDPEFWASRAVAADTARFNATCAPLMGPQLAAFAAQYTLLQRVLVVDAACNERGVSGGLGHIVGDYASWLLWGVLTRRAVFFRYTACAAAGTASCPRWGEDGELTGRAGDPACNRTDLGRFFTGPGGADWAWSNVTEAAVAAAAAGRETRLRAPADLAPDAAALFDKIIADADAYPWVLLRLEWGSGLTPLVARVSEGIHPNYAETLHGEGYWRLAAALGVEAQLPEAAAEGGGRSRAAALEAAHGLHLRGCALHFLLRPRPALQAALLPAARRFGAAASVVALHVRSGFADVAAAGAPSAAAFNASAAAAAPGVDVRGLFEGAPESRWARFSDLFAAPALFPRRNDAPETAACGSAAAGSFTLGAGAAAGLAPYVTCAARAAQRVAAQRAADAAAAGVAPADAPKAYDWAVFLATDSPGLQTLMPSLPWLRDHMVGCLGEHCAEGDDAHKGRRTHAAQLQAVMELYLLGMADHVLPVTRSSFQRFADRGFGFGGVPQLLSGPASPPGPWEFAEQPGSRRYERRLPVCAALGGRLATLEKAQQNATDRACEHMRYALLSDWLVDGLRFDAPEGGAAGASSAA